MYDSSIFLWFYVINVLQAEVASFLDYYVSFHITHIRELTFSGEEENCKQAYSSSTQYHKL